MWQAAGTRNRKLKRCRSFSRYLLLNVHLIFGLYCAIYIWKDGSWLLQMLVLSLCLKTMSDEESDMYSRLNRIKEFSVLQ